MKALINLVRSLCKCFKFFWLIAALSILLSSCINNEKIETYRNTGEAQYHDLIKQMEVQYAKPKTDTIIINSE